MKISKLWDRYKGQNAECYIIGTGPSLKLFPSSMYRNKITIGLNEAWKVVKCTYNLTIHPDLIPDNYYALDQIWITKRKGKYAGHQGQVDRDFYWFNNQTSVKDYTPIGRHDDTLYVGRGIHTAALCLVAAMGLARAILVGCDLSIAPTEHATGEGVGPLETATHRGYSAVSLECNFHGLSSEAVCREYYLNAVEVRSKLKEVYPDFTILSLSPFLAPAYWKEEYLRFNPPTVVSKDVSTYIRERPDFE